MKKTSHLRSVLTLGVSAAALCATPSLAATASGSGQPDGDTGNKIQEVVVTAQKRTENINKVGLAITAASAVQLQEKGVTSVADLVKIEPSLQFSQAQSGTPVYTLRGVGYFEQSLSASPAVSIYQDEVAFPYPVMSKGVLLDPERVEILKGPQGTLYGQNATGGLINFIAAKPTDTDKVGVDESINNYGDNLVSGFLSGPLTSTVSARLSASFENGGAWQKSVTRDQSLGDKDTQIGRLILDWRPTSSFKASLNVNGWLDRSDTQAGQLEGYRLQAPQNVGAANISNPAFYHPAPVGSAAFNAYPGPIQAELSEPIAPNNARAADWVAGSHPRNNESFFQTNLRLDYSFNDNLGVTSISNYEAFTESNLVDQAGIAAPGEASKIRGNVLTYSQELRLHGTFDSHKINWLVGANAESDKVDENDDVTLVSTASYAPAALGLPPFLEFGAVGSDKAITTSVFANAEYHVFDTLSIHGGIRYTKSDQTLSGCSYSTFPSVTILQNAVAGELAGLYGGTSVPGVPGHCVTLTPPPNFSPGSISNKLDQSNVPWRVGIDWTPLDHTLFYFTVSKGYKAGSSPALGASQYTQLKPVTQESLLSYEVGAKSELFDRTLLLNLAVFHYDYTNKQELGRLLDPVYGAVQTLLNIPKSKEDGVEFSAVWRPIRGLTLNGAVTYLDSEVTSSFRDFGPYPLGPTDLIDFKGESFPFTPKWSVQYGARYDWDLWNGMAAFVSADASYQTKAASTFGAEEAAADNAPPLQIKAYGLLNLTAGVSSADHHWRLEVFGKNVTDTYYWNTVNYISDTTVRLAGLPATYGVRLSYRY